MKLYCVTFLFINYNNNSNSLSSGLCFCYNNKFIVMTVEEHCKTDEWECLTTGAARCNITKYTFFGKVV